ncbi:MAG: phosphotransacetylase [Actinobacteria bacterium]|nr:phosphotransacetylase [Actinomycetota bacterium]MCA1722186.1 phosphotransacetylase [Actinomycetota bacterium]
MTVAPTCPRCPGDLRAPGLMSSSWTCERHGAVHPLHVIPRPSNEALRKVGGGLGVPLWSPLPLLLGWTVTGLATAGDDRGPAKATVLALSGPSPLGGPADLLLVAEEPGVGLGARYAGIPSLDPGACTAGPPDAKVEAAGHPTALWSCASADDRAAFVGEAKGVWLYAVLWPPAAELVLLEHVVLHDLRDAVHAAIDLPFGAPSPRLAAA